MTVKAIVCKYNITIDWEPINDKLKKLISEAVMETIKDYYDIDENDIESSITTLKFSEDWVKVEEVKTETDNEKKVKSETETKEAETKYSDETLKTILEEIINNNKPKWVDNYSIHSDWISRGIFDSFKKDVEKKWLSKTIDIYSDKVSTLAKLFDIICK